MKNNTQETKALLTQALRAVPDDFALSEVRTAIRGAIAKLESVETKRERRENQQIVSNQWPVVNGQLVNPFSVQKAIDMIDDMIASERKKIEEIHNRRKTKNDGEDEDLQTILG